MPRLIRNELNYTAHWFRGLTKFIPLQTSSAYRLELNHFSSKRPLVDTILITQMDSESMSQESPVQDAIAQNVDEKVLSDSDNEIQREYMTGWRFYVLEVA